MTDWMIFLLTDLKKGWDELGPTDFAQPSFLGLWGVIVFLPLAGIDRRDIIAGLVYTLFCVAAGAMLVFALPMQFIPAPTFRNMIFTLLAMAGIAGIRWFYQWNGKRDGKRKEE